MHGRGRVISCGLTVWNLVFIQIIYGAWLFLCSCFGLVTKEPESAHVPCQHTCEQYITNS